RRRHTRLQGDWSSDVCSSDLKFLSTAAIIFSLTILGAEAKPPAGSPDASSHVNKGVELAQQHKYDEAIKEFSTAIEANPKSPKRSEERRVGKECRSGREAE